MAILAALSDVAEHRLYVTTNAGDGLVHTAKRISRLIVIEFGNGTDRPPPIGGVTVLAGNIEVSMRAPRYIGRLRLCRARTRRTRHQSHCNEPEYAPST